MKQKSSPVKTGERRRYTRWEPCVETKAIVNWKHNQYAEATIINFSQTGICLAFPPAINLSLATKVSFIGDAKLSTATVQWIGNQQSSSLAGLALHETVDHVPIDTGEPLDAPDW